MKLITVTEKEAGQRLDKLLAKYLDKAPKSFFYKMLRKKNITLNKKKAEGNERLVKGDEIRLFLAEETIAGFTEKKEIVHTEEKLSVIYENEHVLLLNKPCGMLSQRAQKSDISMVEHVISYLLAKGELTEEELATFRPSVCNRLDRNTSGILTAGKTLLGLQMMSKLIKERQVRKFYLCIAVGVMKKPQELKGWLWKDTRTNQVRIYEKQERKDALPVHTRFYPIADNGQDTLLEVELLTGRTHQIRAHLSSIGHPLYGDPKYGNKKRNAALLSEFGLKGQLLHAWCLEMPKLTGELADISQKRFCAPAPELFLKIAAKKGLGTWQHGVPEGLEGPHWRS